MEKSSIKMKNFLKRYGFYILAGLLAIAITLTLTLGIKPNEPTQQKVEVEEPIVDVDSNAIVFSLPLENASVLKGFSSTDLMFNSTLGHWESHKAIDLISSSSKSARACLAGTVTSAETTYAYGTTIEITHKNGFISKYSSLSNSLVAVGDSVDINQTLGEISSSAANEASLGEHLHFELKKDGVKVDPSVYLDLSEK